MKSQRLLGIAVILALLVSMIGVLPASANPPSPDGHTAVQSNDTAPSGKANVKPIDQPNIKDYQRNQARMRLLESGRTEAADQLSLTTSDRVLVLLVEYAGSDTFTWNAGDHWDPLGVADPNEAVYDADGNVVVGDCSNIITQTRTFSYTGPLHNQIPRPLSADDRSGDSIWTPDFSSSWFNSFMFGNGVVFDYTRQDGSQVHEDFTGKSVKNFYLDMSGGQYDIEGDVVGWLQLPHSTWYYGADRCPGNRSGMTSGAGADGGIPDAGSTKQLVRDALDAVNAAYPNFDWARYDQDHDGIIDRLWIVHSGYGEEDGTVLLNRTDYGEAAVWSHSGGVTPPYPVAPGIAAGPYIMMPENGGIGVFAHEYGHNLGAMDLYTYGIGETSAGFWTIMADDWTGYPIGFQPPAADPMHLDWWGWLDPMTISDPSQVYTVKLGQASEFPGGEGVYRGAKIELPDGVAPLAVPVWQGNYYWWGGKEDVANGMMTTAAPIAIPAGGAALSFDLAYDIEPGWDFLWIQASADGQNWTTLTNANTVCEHDASWIGGNYGFPDDLCAAGIGGFSGYGEDTPAAQTFDLGGFAGQNVWLRFWYMTDWGTTGAGPFVDSVTVTSGGTTLFADDAESGDAKWTYDAPWQRSNGTLTFSQNFYLQWRNVSSSGGYDSALGDARWRFGPANTGLVVWYNNNFYSDNEIFNYLTDFPSFGPKGRMLVLDSHSEPYRDPYWVAAGYNNEAANILSRSQMRDAPLSLWDSVDFTVEPPYAVGPTQFDGRPAVLSFHDSMGYYPGSEFVPGGPVGQTNPRWMTKQWDASTVMPATSAYAVKAPGYNGTDRFRFDCSLNAIGQVLCYSYPSGLGTPGGSGNPGDDMAQYGWHVEILDQTDSMATVKIWNAMMQVDGTITQTSSTTPTVGGSYVEVAVNTTNIGGALEDGMIVVPVDPDAMYVPGSAYGGATPLTAGYAAQLAQERNLANLADLAANAKSPEDVVAVAWMGPIATGEMLDFGFSVKVTAMSGELQHDAAVFDGATFVNAITGSPMTIVDNSTYPISRSRRFDVDRDTFIDGTQPSGFFGSAQTMWVGFFDQQRPLVHTPLQDIPTDAFVENAFLYLYVYEGHGWNTWANSVINVDAHAVTTEWMPFAANWWMPWSMPGGDFGPAVGTNHLGSGKLGTWLRLDVTSAVEDMLRGGFNQGFILTSNDTQGVQYAFATRENWTGKTGYIRVHFRTAQ